MNNCNDMLAYFYNVVLSLLDTYLPMQRIRVRCDDKPWVNDFLRELIRRRQYAWAHGNTAEYNKLRNKVQRTTRSLKNQYYNKCVSGLRQNCPRKWWSGIKKITRQHKPSCLSNIARTKYDGDLNLLANDINSFLYSVSSDLEPLPSDFLSLYNSDDSENSTDFNEYIIEPYAVEKKLNSIDIHKSNGPDDVPNWFLRDFSAWLAEPLAAIFNMSVCSGHVPCSWKRANVTPIPKTDRPTSIESDIRPISLTSTLSKILESFVGQWVLDCVSQQIDGNQFGGIKGKSTTHALVHMLHSWHTALDECKQVQILFIDYAKAFDHVDHTTFIVKLCKFFSIPQLIIRWLHSFLFNRHQRIKIGKTVSEWVSLNGGLPQGSWLAPLVFILFINDLKIDDLIYKYIDDLTISDIFNRNGHDRALKKYADYIDSWSKSNKLKINVKKTKSMSLLNTESDPNICIDDELIQTVTSYKLLGVHIDSDLKWNTHIDSIYKKSSSRLYFLKHLRRNNIQPIDLFYYYKTIVRPVLEYACPAWHSSITITQSNKLETIQKRALSIIFGSYVYDQYENFCSANEIFTLKERRETLSRSFFTKAVLNKAGTLNHLITKPENSQNLAKLRHNRQYNIPKARTARYEKSFIIHGLHNYM